MKKTLFFSAFALLFFVQPAEAQMSTSTQYYNDVKLESITVSPANPAVNQLSIIKVKVKNIGTNNLMTSLGLSAYSHQLNNFSVSKFTYESPSYDDGKIFSPDGYFYYYAEGRFTKAGTTTLSFIVNSNHELVEEKKDENNQPVELYSDDSAIAQVGVSPETAQNLSVSSITMDSASPLINTQVKIKVDVKNTGQTGVTDRSIFEHGNVQFNFADFTLTDFTASAMPSIESPLNPGSIFSYTYYGKFLTAGDKKLDFKMDRSDVLKEGNEIDNYFSTTTKIYMRQSELDDFSFSQPLIEAVSSSSVMISLTTSKNSNVKAYYGAYGITSVDYFVESKDATNHKIQIDGLVPGMKYKIDLVMTSGTSQKTGDGQTFITLPVSDELKFSESPSVISTGKDFALIGWKTNLVASAVVYYKANSASAYSNVSTSTNSTASSLKLGSLGAWNYDYYVVVTANDYSATSSIAHFSIGSVASTPTQTPTNNTTQMVSSPVNTTTNIASSVNAFSAIQNSLYGRLKGKIVLKVQSGGEAYYLNPKTGTVNFLGKPDDAYQVMRSQGVGIKTADLKKIPISTDGLSGDDADKDGLPDSLEDAIGTDKTKADSDGDGYGDKDEVAGGFNPSASGAKMPLNTSFAAGQSGKIFLQVESRGEAWYVNPSNNRRYFLGRAADAFGVMRRLGLGIANKDFESLRK